MPFPVASYAGVAPRHFKTPLFSGKKGDDEDTKLTGKELAALLTPDTLSTSPFSRLHNVSAISLAHDSIPEGRRRSGFFHRNEDDWIREIERRITRGDIDPQTLCVFDTGHGLAIAEPLTRHFGTELFINVDKDNSDVRRIQDQAQSFAQAIGNNRRAVTRKGASTALLIDTHRNRPVPEAVIDALPNADTLLKMGIHKIFIGLETFPNRNGPEAYRTCNENNDFWKWLNQLGQDGRIRMLVDGIDTRHKPAPLYVEEPPAKVLLQRKEHSAEPSPDKRQKGGGSLDIQRLPGTAVR